MLFYALDSVIQGQPDSRKPTRHEEHSVLWDYGWAEWQKGDIKRQREKTVSPLCGGKKEWGRGVVVMFSSDHDFLIEFDCPKIFPELHRLVIWDRAHGVSGVSERTFTLASIWFVFGACKVGVDIASSHDTGLRFKCCFLQGEGLDSLDSWQKQMI